MPLLNASSFGKYASMPMGWIFMALIVILEAVIMSQILSRKSLNIRIIAPVVVSNFVSGALGAAVSKAINDGWMLVVWFPWVSGVEVDTANPESLYHLIIYFVVALVATVLVEILINGMLMKRRGFKNVARATMIANVVSYLLGCFVLYTYSFVFFD